MDYSNLNEYNKEKETKGLLKEMSKVITTAIGAIESDKVVTSGADYIDSQMKI
jgi:hypothetical protein